nr:ATP-binding protein [uncultured Halomonas sp.]
MKIILPKRFERDSIDALFVELERSQKFPDEVVLDFSALSYSMPTAMLVAGSKIRGWVKERHENGYISKTEGISYGVAAHSYLMHLGFFDFIYINTGKRMGEAKGSGSYLPITRISRPDVLVEESGLEEWYSAIESKARKLAVILSGSCENSQELRTYTYSIREIIRNVFEHSGVTECYICGQRWWNNRVEISVLDEGVGISSTLRKAFEVQEDADALDMAINAGVSRTSFMNDDDNLYQNSGFGLYVLRHVGASFGWFAIGSGSSKLIAVKGDKFFSEFRFDGTFIGLQLEKTPRNFRDVLTDIIESGEEDLQRMGVSRKASARSKLL